MARTVSTQDVMHPPDAIPFALWLVIDAKGHAMQVILASVISVCPLASAKMMLVSMWVWDIPEFA